MLKRNNKKGFTLAELLIVVAIIAVLVAIAVPLFVGALNDAEERVKDANIRSVRAAAVSEILLDSGNKGYAKTTGEGANAPKYYDGCWIATAQVDTDGTVSALTIVLTDNFAEPTIKLSDKTGYCEKEGSNTYYTVIVKITELKAS